MFLLQALYTLFPLWVWFLLPVNPAPSLPQKGLCAHRGAMESHPENTIPAFQQAIHLGAQMIEFDIRMTKDNALVIMHDETVDRTTDGKGKISDLTLPEIMHLDAGVRKGPGFKGTRVPTFREVLDIMPRNIWLNCHLKGDREAGAAAAALIRQCGRTHQAVLACGEEAAKAALETAPDLIICNMEEQYRKETETYIQATIRKKAGFIQLLRKDFPTASQLNALKENGVRINYFYAQKPEEIRGLFEAGIDFILVNDLEAFISKAGEAGIRPVEPQF